MDNNLAYNKAWLQLSDQGVITYKPVIIMARTSQSRSFVADLNFQEAQFVQGRTAQGHKTNKKNHNDLNNGVGYFVQHSNLVPRSGLNSLQDLMRMQYPNIPELKHMIRNSRRKHKFIRIANNLLLDLTTPTPLSSLQSSSVSSTSLNSQLINFYKIHILSFALDKKQTKMQMLLLPSHQNQLSKQTTNNYVTLLLETLAAQQQLWPHTLHLANLATIIDMLMPELCLKIELGFGTFDFKNSNRIYFVKILPFNHALFTCSKYTMECLMKISSSSKFTQMYKGPINSQNSATESWHCQKLAQSLLSLSFQVPQIHSIMRTISLLCNLHSLTKFQPNSSSYTTKINNIEELLRIQKGRLEHLLNKAENQSIFLQGTLEENVLYRINHIIDAVYEGFVIGLCRKIGQKMIVEGRNQNIVGQQHCKDKLLTVILDNTYANIKENRQLQSKSTYYQRIRKTHQQILKNSIHKSPKLQPKSKPSSPSPSSTTSNIYITHLKQKKEHFLSTPLSETPNKNKQIQFIDKQILQFDYHQQIINSQFMFQVFIGMFQGHYQRKDRVKEAMLMLDDLGCTGKLAVVAGVAVLDQHGLAEVVEAIRIRQKEIGSELFKAEREGISQMTLFEFCNRYFYTKYCQGQQNPQMSSQLKKSRILPKRQLLTLSSPYLDHETAVLQSLPKMKQKIRKQSPEDISMEMQNKYKLQDSNVRIRSIEFMEKMEKEVEMIKAKVQKIESQVVVYLRRKKTFRILKLIWRETKMEKLLDKILTNNYMKLSGFAMSTMKQISIQKKREQQQKQQQRRRQEQRIKQQQREKQQQKKREQQKQKQQKQRKMKEEQIKREQEQQRLKKQQEQQQMQKIRSERVQEQKIMEKQAEEEMKGQIIKEKDEQQKQQQKEMQNQKSISIDKQILLQRQMELITQRERKMVEEQIQKQQQIERRKAIEQQKQRQRQREIQRQRERQREIQRQKERERQRQREEQMERQKRQQLERQEIQRELKQMEQRKRKQAEQAQQEQRAKRQQEQKEKQAEINRQKSQMKKYERYEQVSNNEQPKTKMKKQMSIKSIEPSNEPSSKNTPMSAYKVQVREVNTPENESMQQQPRTQQFETNKLSAMGSDVKRSQSQYISKSENLEQLTQQQLASLQDNPQFNYEYWFQNSNQIFEIDFSRKQIFNPYIDNPIPGKPELDQKLHPDQQILDLLQDSHYIAYTKQITDHQTEQEYVRLMMHQPKLIQKPMIKFYNIYSFPTFFKDSFNAILKIGQDKNTTKPLHQVFNIFFVPLIQTYYKEIKEQNTLFHEEQMIAHDYHSVHNRLVDQVFLQFMKQITPAYPQTYPKKNMHAYLFGLSVFTRYFHPSPNFIYPLTYYVYFIYKQSIKENADPIKTELLQSVFENLLFFIQATEGFKRNPVKGFLRRKKTEAATKNQAQCAGYLHPRTTPITQAQINKPQPGKKPQPPSLTIWLSNNWSLTYFIRNQIAKSLKKRMLSQLGVLAYERAYSLAYMESDNTLTPIDDKQKVSVLFQECQKVEKKFQRKVYLRMDYYVAFQLGEVGTMRLTYLNMILDEPTYPWVSIKYEFLMFMATLFKQFVEKRAQNYVKMARQWKLKICSPEQLCGKFPKFLATLPQKHPQVEYFRFMVSTGFGVAKSFKKTNDAAYRVIVKPLQIAIYKKQQKKVSIGFKRIRNAYIEDKDKRIIIELYLKDQSDKNEQNRGRLKTWTIQEMENMKQLFKCILFYLENQKPTTPTK